MRVFLAISCLAALAAARPDVSHLGYKYHAGFSGTTVGPTVIAKSNGIAIDATIAPTLDPLGITTTIAPSLAPLGFTSTVAPAIGYDAGSLLHSTPLSLGFGSGFDSFAASAIPSTIAPFGVTPAPTAFSAFGLDASLIPSTIAPIGLGGYGFDGGAAAGYIHHQTPIVSKHFYLHSAPEEARDEYHRHLVLGTPQKSYRVVFIKAPSSQTATRISASFAPTEEKTVIYVLSKKPEDLQINDIQAPQPTEPSKPEVFFIKYKTPEEAVHAQQQIQAQYDALGGYSQVSDEGVSPLTSVIGSLGQSISEVDIANARFDTVHAPVHLSAPLAAGAIHHVGSPLSTIAPTLGAYSFGGLTSTVAPTVGPYSFGGLTSTVAPAVGPYSFGGLTSTVAPTIVGGYSFGSTVAPAYGTFGADALSLSTLAPAVSTVGPLLGAFSPAVSTVAPAISALEPAISTLAPAVSTIAPAVSTLAPAVSTIAPAISTLEPALHDSYLPPRKH